MRKKMKQLNAIKAWIGSVAPVLDADLSIKLWDGDIVPLGRNASKDILLCIRSPYAIRRLIFSPKLTTLFELYAENLIDIEGGTPLEAIRRWDHITALNLVRSFRKRDLVKVLWPFVFGTSEYKTTEDDYSYSNSIAKKISEGRNDQDLIRFHYDVSNRFYSLFLDPEMVYSCAYFETPDASLADAQIAKLDMICKKLRLKEGEYLFDVGCGWGALVCYAAQHYGVNAYGVTLSQKQFDYAQAKIERLGLEDKVTIELLDYRNVQGKERFDKIVQVGMFEHVGIDNHDTYFQHIHRLLKPNGLYLHHAITRKAIKEIKNFRKPSAYQEIVSRFIFPGGELDYIGLTLTNLERHRFEVHDVEGWREHYWRTLEKWIQNLWDNRETARQDVGWTKTRLWLLYFSLFVVAFERNTVGLYQTLSSKRRVGTSPLPSTRKDLYCDAHT